MEAKRILIIGLCIFYFMGCKPTGGCYLKDIMTLVINDGTKEYIGIVTDIDITFKKKVSCDINKVVITNITYVHKATSNKIVGDSLEVNKNNIITVMACDGTKQDYTVLIESEICSGNGLVLGKKIAYKDNVSGYTIKQIEDALYNQKTWLQWRDNLKSKYNNKTEAHVDAAFHYWGNE